MQLPANASIAQKLFYGPIRSGLFFFFSYLPYYPVRRVNKPNLSNSVFIWASSHSNLLCDVVPAGYEGPAPTKFLGKSTLFFFPLNHMLTFIGALPLTRASDFKEVPPAERRRQNEQTFEVAFQAMEKGWSVAIYPEGVCIVNPGLVLPLKPGISRLAFGAERKNKFQLGLKIIPVGLEYGSRRKVGSGLTIRYGKPILIKDYQRYFEKDEDLASKLFMQDLTKQMVAIFPHFEDELKLQLAKKLCAMGISPNKFAAAQLFLAKKDSPEFWSALEEKVRKFEETTKEYGIPIPAWGLQRQWTQMSLWSKLWRSVVVVLWLPFTAYDLLNNSMPELVLMSVVEFLAMDETEHMTYRFLFSPIFLSLSYGLQFLLLKYFVFDAYLAHAGVKAWFAYMLASFAIWYCSQHWRRLAKRIMSGFFFLRASKKGRNLSVHAYRDLRKQLGELKHYR